MNMSNTVSTITIENIRKRDGRVVPFDLTKITAVIESAFEATQGRGRADEAERLAGRVLEILSQEGEAAPDVEHIQDTVEAALIEAGHVKTAKAFILYRAERSRAREMNTRLMKTYEEIIVVDADDSDMKRDNANINGDTAMGAMLKFGSEGAKHFYDMFILKAEHAAAHREGDIQIHDLDFLTLTTTCSQIDMIKLFKDGFSTGHGTLREPSGIASYAALCCIAIQSNQSDQHGGQSVANFDYGMALGVAKTFVTLYRKNLSRAIELTLGVPDPEESTVKPMIQGIIETTGLKPSLEENGAYRKEEQKRLAVLYPEADVDRIQAFVQESTIRDADRATYQAMEALVHNLNTMNSRAGAQVPFSTVNYGMDTSAEGRMVIKNILLATEAGLGHGETPIFPIQVFRVKAGISFNPGDPNYDLFQLACRVSAKRLYPNFAFQDAPFNSKYYQPGRPETEIAYMGCRTRVIGNAYDPEREISFGRGNLSFTSINLPRLAIQAKENVELFFEQLDHKMDLVVEQMLERYAIQARKRVKNFPFLMGQGVWLDSEKLGWNDTVGEVLKHGTMAIGFIGLAETLTALVGAHHGESEKARNLGLEIIGHMRERADKESKERGLNFTLLSTPAEGLSGRFVRIDKQKFGEIPGVTDKEYYTNGFHLPVSFTVTAYDKINIEAPYHALTNAGHITYIELDGDTADNLEAFEKIIRHMQASGVGYGSINHPVDRDPVCSFVGVIGTQCPGCGRFEDDVKFERIRRITGYLVGTLDKWNNAKRAEERDRIKHGC
jgi:ribonucleoside-triphosphate reductase